MNLIKSLISQRAFYIISLFSAGVCVLFFVVSQPRLVAVALIGSVSFLILAVYWPPVLGNRPRTKLSSSRKTRLNIIIVILCTCSFLLLYVLQAEFSGFLMLVFSSVVILWYTESSGDVVIHYLIIILSISWIRLWYKFDVVGGDTYYHLINIEEIIARGSIPSEGTIYSLFNQFQIQFSEIILVTGIEYSTAIVSYIVVFAILVSTTSTIISRRVFDHRIYGVYAAILGGLFPFTIWYTYQFAPLTTGIALIFPWLVVVLNNELNENHLFVIAETVLLIAISLQHPLAAIMSIIISITYLDGSGLEWRSGIRRVTILLIPWLILESINLFGKGAIEVYDLIQTVSRITSNDGANSTRLSGSALTPLEYIESILFSAPVGLITGSGIAVVIFLYSQSKQNKVDRYLISVMILLIFVSFASFSSVFGISSIYPYRWYGLCAVLVITVFIIPLKNLKSSRYLIVCFLLLSLFLFHPIAAIDSPGYSEDQSIRWAIDKQESAAAEWGYQNGGDLRSDSTVTFYFRYLSGSQKFSTASVDGYLTLVRPYIFENVYYGGKNCTFTSVYERNSYIKPQLSGEFDDKIPDNNKVYSNGGSQQIYSKKPICSI